MNCLRILSKKSFKSALHLPSPATDIFKRFQLPVSINLVTCRPCTTEILAEIPRGDLFSRWRRISGRSKDEGVPRVIIGAALSKCRSRDLFGSDCVGLRRVTTRRISISPSLFSCVCIYGSSVHSSLRRGSYLCRELRAFSVTCCIMKPIPSDV